MEQKQAMQPVKQLHPEQIRAAGKRGAQAASSAKLRKRYLLEYAAAIAKQNQ